MWPMLLDMTRDDCRRTLRRLELEAYSSMISVFRAQGPLADDRKKLLEDIRGALNISSDRHTAEARRASNDELLATIAEQLTGPNTGLGWACEGRRKIPILPRGIPQTMYTEIADKAASIASQENEKLALKIQEQKLVSPKSPAEAPAQDMEAEEAMAATGDSARTNAQSIKNKVEGSYPPVVMWDQSLKVANDEGPPRKRSRSDCATPQHHRATHQRYLNISQIYSNYSKTTSGKISNQYGKNSYNQGGKMSGKMSGKSNHGHVPKSSIKHRSLQGKHGAAGKHSGQVAIPHHQVRSGIKSPTDPHIVGSKALNIQNQIDSSSLKSQTSGFQANFAKSLIQNACIEESNDMKQTTSNILESPTMQLLTQPPLPQEALTENPLGLMVQHNVSGKPCHLIIKKKTDSSGDTAGSQKIQVTNMQIISKPTEMSGIKVLQNRQVVMAPAHCTSQKLLNSSGKLLTTKMVQQIPQKSQAQLNTKSPTSNSLREKVLIVSKSPISSTVQPSILQRSLSNSSKKIIISGHGNPSPASKEGELPNRLDHIADSEGISKDISINNSDMKMQTKTFLLNPKSVQKMVVVPAKTRPKGMGQTMPMLQVKGVPGRPTMKFVPVSNQSVNSQTKSSNLTVVSKPATPVNKLSTNVQIASIGSSQAIIRPAGSKGNVILVQKGNTLGKGAITFTKNGNDLSKLVMSNKINPVTSQANVTLPKIISAVPESSVTANVNKNPGNVILLEVSNDQIQNSGNLTDFLEGEGAATALTPADSLKSERAIITEDTPVLFHNQLSDDVCNADSMESTTDSLMEVVHMDDSVKSNDSFSEEQVLQKLNETNKVSSENPRVVAISSDWDMECGTEDNISDKEKSINKSDELRLELESSSDSDTDGYIGATEGGKRKHPSQDEEPSQRDQRNADEPNEIYAKHSSINQASRTLLSQLQDEGSSSNDSPFVLAKSLGKPSSLLNKFNVQKETNAQLSSEESSKRETLSLKSKEDKSIQSAPDILSGKPCTTKSETQASRVDIFSTAIASADINLDSYEYLEDGIMSGDDMFHLSSGEHVKGVSSSVERTVSLTEKDKHHGSLEQFDQLLNEEHIDADRLEALEPSSRSGAME